MATMKRPLRKQFAARLALRAGPVSSLRAPVVRVLWFASAEHAVLG